MPGKAAAFWALKTEKKRDLQFINITLDVHYNAYLSSRTIPGDNKSGPTKQLEDEL